MRRTNPYNLPLPTKTRAVSSAPQVRRAAAGIAFSVAQVKLSLFSVSVGMWYILRMKGLGLFK